MPSVDVRYPWTLKRRYLRWRPGARELLIVRYGRYSFTVSTVWLGIGTWKMDDRVRIVYAGVFLFTRDSLIQ